MVRHLKSSTNTGRKLTLEPADVFLLLLDLDVVGNHVGKLGVDAALLKVALKVGLQILVQVLERRTGVKTLPSPVLLSGDSVGQVGLGEEGDFLNLEQAVLGKGLNKEGTVSGLLDGDIYARREARFQVLLLTVGRGDTVLRVLSKVSASTLVRGLVAFEVHSIGKAVQVIVFAQVLEVRNGERKADPREVLAFKRKKQALRANELDV